MTHEDGPREHLAHYRPRDDSGWDPVTQVWRAARPDSLLPIQALTVLFRAWIRNGWRNDAVFRHVVPAVRQQDGVM